MTITTLSSRQFNQDASKAKKAAKDGPVFITDRGRPAHVLLTFEEYKSISAVRDSMCPSRAASVVDSWRRPRWCMA